MSSQATRRPNSLLQEQTTVDMDVHLFGGFTGITIDDVAPYISTPAENHLRHPSKFPFPTNGWNRSMGGKIKSVSFENAEQLNRQLCVELGVDYPVLNAMSYLPKMPQADLAVELMRGFNDAVIAKYLDEYDHFRGLITIATQKPAEAAEEIDRLADEDQIVGLYIATGGPMYPLGHPRYDVMYDAAQDNDMAIVYHGHFGAFNQDFPRQHHAVNNMFTVHPLAHAWDQMLTVASLLGEGTPAKFPDLNFVFVEAGIGWVPYMMFRYNKEYAIRRSEVPLLEKTPEEYIRDQFYFATQPLGEPNDYDDLALVAQALGADSIMFSTDFPHWDFDNPETIDRFFRQTFSEEELDRIFSGNAREAVPRLNI